MVACRKRASTKPIRLVLRGGKHPVLQLEQALHQERRMLALTIYAALSNPFLGFEQSNQGLRLPTDDPSRLRP